MTPFKPLSLSELLDMTFKFYRDHFKIFFLTLISIQSITYVISKILLGTSVLQLSRGLMTARNIGSFLASAAVVSVVSLAGNMIALGALTFMISDFLMNNPTSISQAMQQLRSRFWPLIGTTLLGGLITFCGLLLCIIPGIYFFLSYLLSAQIVLLEGLSGMPALDRSKELMRTKSEKGFTRSNIFKASVLLLVVGVIAYSVQTVTSLPQIAYFAYKAFKVSGNVRPDTMFGNSPVQIATEIFQIIGFCLTKPLGMIGLILLYYDIRSRKEGLDLELMAEAIAPVEKPIGS